MFFFPLIKNICINTKNINHMSSYNKSYFEKVLFKFLVERNSIMSKIGRYIYPDLFEEKSFKVIVSLCIKFYEKYSKVPSKEEMLISSNKAFVECVQTAYSLIEDIDITKIDENVFLTEVEQYIKEDMATRAVISIADKISKNQIEPDKIVDEFEKVSSIRVLNEGCFDIYENIDDWIVRLTRGEERLPTGFKDIDENIGGGLFSSGKCVGVITAPPNMGKSIMLGNLATNAARMGKNVMIITLEMSEDVYAKRIYSDLYNMDISTIHMETDELREKIKNKKYGKIYIKEFPPATMTVDNLDGYVETEIKNGKNIDLLVIDYLTLLYAKGAENSNENGKIITRKLRALTYKYNFPIWTACQINRDGMGNDKPEMKYIAESIAIAAEADLIISLWRKEEDSVMNVMRAWFLKSRFGRNDFGIKFHFNHESLRFEDMKEGSEPSQNETQVEEDDNGGINELLKNIM